MMIRILTALIAKLLYVQIISTMETLIEKNYNKKISERMNNSHAQTQYKFERSRYRRP